MADKVIVLTHRQVDESTQCEGHLIETLMTHRCSGCRSMLPRNLLESFANRRSDHQTVVGHAVVIIEEDGGW